MQKVLINGLQLGKQLSGVQYYIKHLLNSISNIKPDGAEITFLVPKSYSPTELLKTHIKLHNVGFNTNNRTLRISFEHFNINRLIKHGRYDIFHSPTYVLPRFCSSKKIVTIHDTIALDYPELCSPTNGNYFKLMLPRTIRQADKIIAVSQKVKHDIIRHFKVQENRISVIHNGLSPIYKPVINTQVLQRVRKRYKLPNQFLLFVGNIEPKKNLKLLIQSYTSLIKRYNIKHQLIIIGQLAWKYKEVLSMIEQNPFKHKIKLLGYVEEIDLPAIYSLASVFVFPSLYEGFGYPVLESMACGTPVICSNRGALPEITGGNCLLIDPMKKEQLDEAIIKLITDELIIPQLTRNGLNWAGKFSMESCTFRTLNIYKALS